MISVYFDASFFVNLRVSGEEQAIDVIDRLNDLNVRPVLSRPLFWEVMSTKAPQGELRNLYDRIGRFRRTTLSLDDGLTWLPLLAPPQERLAFAEAMKQIDAPGDKVRSVRHLAEGSDPSHTERFIASQTTLAKESGLLDAEGHFDISRATEFLNRFLGFDLNSVAPEEIPARIEAQLRRHFGDDLVDATKAHSLYTDSVFDGTLRPERHATGDLGQKAEGKLGRDYRDADHMACFELHANDIDYLQLDSKQLRKALASPNHQLTKSGLVKRCFAADSLAAIEPAIRALIDPVVE